MVYIQGVVKIVQGKSIIVQNKFVEQVLGGV